MTAGLPTARSSAPQRFIVSIVAVLASILLSGCLLLFDSGGDEPPPSGGTSEIELQMVLIRSGSFIMGSPDSEVDRESDETQHRVNISSDFWLGTYEVTQYEWRSLMGNNPSSFSSCGDDCPVETVNWFEAVAFANTLSRSEGLQECYALSGCSSTDPSYGMECSSVSFSGLDCEGYRLPTESEWEYAARAGSSTAWYCGSNESCVDTNAWHSSNADGRTHAVGGKDANDWDLYDMAGNVWEWTSDWSGDYPTGVVTDPTGSTSGQLRVLRGGSWYTDAHCGRSAYRFSFGPGLRYDSLGFRLARSAP